MLKLIHKETTEILQWDILPESVQGNMGIFFPKKNNRISAVNTRTLWAYDISHKKNEIVVCISICY
ncbi:MAG: hypothetical protein OEZ13_11195 [Spirochaetia bacterium]|nr:hypothetical protein [Spirochaetia bacterium]